MTKLFWMTAMVGAAGLLGSLPTAWAQQEGGVTTQMLVNVEAKATPPASASALTVTVGDRKEQLSAWSPVLPAGAQVALLIDDGLRESVGRELGSLRNFVGNLPSGVEVLVGYMQNGRVVQASPFITDHRAAAESLRLPEGIAGGSASPYFCLSDFVKHWPGEGASAMEMPAPGVMLGAGPAPAGKARFVLMITNGVDPYNGSVSPLNQDSPYVSAAITDAQRAGVAVYSIYYGDAGIRGGAASFSGQSYLQNLAQATGGTNYFEGTGNPVSIAPFLTAFDRALASTYVATFDAPVERGGRLVRVKLSSATKTKLHAPEQVRPGNVE